MNIKKVVLAYSGGLDTSIAIKWIQERYRCEVIAFCANLGQKEELLPIRTKALKTGASRVYIADLRREFVKDYVFPMLRANALYEGSYLLGTSIARPLIAKKQMEIAAIEKADAVAHGSTGKGNDQVRFELSYYAIRPDVKVIAPWREWEFDSRASLIRYARKKKIPVPVTKRKPYSMDRNLFHVSYEGGVLEDPWVAPPRDMFVLSLSPEEAPAKPSYLEIGFRKGDPVSLDGRRMSPVKLLEKLNAIGGRHGVGRVDMVENRFVGMKSRGVYETPGGTILHVARRAVESVTLDREVMHIRDGLVQRYAELVYYGYWFSPEREALQAFIDRSQETVTGTARIKLYKGGCSVTGRKAPCSLYRPELATFEAEDIYDQKDAEGFIKINALRLQMQARLKNKSSG